MTTLVLSLPISLHTVTTLVLSLPISQEFVLVHNTVLESMDKMEQREEEAETKWIENWRKSVADLKQLYNPK